ncbi:MAG: prefoldin subunit beta [Promethearchaeota archaeon]
MENLPQDLQQKLRNVQGLQAQLQSLTEQKLRMEVTLKELESAKEYVDGVAADDPIYKSVGGLMVKISKEKAKVDLDESIELINVRLKKLTMNIERSQSRFDSSREEINASLKNRMG